MWKHIARLFGGCGHEWKWKEDTIKYSGNPMVVQRGTCERCGKQKVEQLRVDMGAW